MISLNNISKSYDGSMAVENLSFTLKEGEILALAGSSGCGKSTTLRMINRLIEPSDGSIEVYGQNVKELPLQELRRSIGYVIQAHGLFPHWSIEKNIGTVPRLLKWPKKKIAARIEELMEMFQLDYALYKDKKPHQLSGGQQQRVGVARALASDPSIMLMDEPFGALDPVTRLIMQEEFLSIQKKIQKTIIFVTHDMEEAFKMADQVAIMDQGKLLQMDTAENLLLNPKDDFVAHMTGHSQKSVRFLAQRKVGDYFRPQISMRQREYEAHKGKYNFSYIWILDEEKKPLGYYHFTSEGEEFISIPPSAFLCKEMNLRAALRQMIWSENLFCLPVVNDHEEFLGEIHFKDLSPMNKGQDHA